MIGLLQRVSEASVEIAGDTVARIDGGLLVLVGVERGDGLAQADRLAERLLSYRIFPDREGRMNRSVVEARGAVLLVPQFTLAADTQSGNRPGFSRAAPPELGEPMFEALVERMTVRGLCPARGRFGAHMRVALVNDGPVTFWLQVPV